MSAEGTEGQAAVKEQTAPNPDDPRKPDDPTEVKKPGWKYTFKSALAEFSRDQCTDLAASLTYYAVLSLFPGLLALVSLLGVFGQGQSTVDAILDLLSQAGVNVDSQWESVLTNMVTAGGAGLALFTGIAGAVWSASGYIGAFGRALNRIYQVDEGRPFWKLRPLQLGLTVIVGALVAVVLMGLVVSGPLVQSIGDKIGIGDTGQTIFNIAKWPIILGIVVLIVALLYHATPNVKQPKFRWASVGAAIGILVWVVASAGFGLYVANFGSYNKTYGSLAGVIVFLLWLWLTNLALLFGAEVDSELERARQLQAGIVAEETLQLPPRDDKNSKKAAAKLAKKVAQGRALRLSSGNSDGDEGTDGGRSGKSKSAQAKSTQSKAKPAKVKPTKKKSDDDGDKAPVGPPLSQRPATPQEQPVTKLGFLGMIGLVITNVLARRKRQQG